MNWRYIRNEQPKEDATIVQLDKPYNLELYQGLEYIHWPMAMRIYSTYGQKWEDYCHWCKDRNIELPDYHWIYADEFPFPDYKEVIQ